MKFSDFTNVSNYDFTLVESFAMAYVLLLAGISARWAYQRVSSRLEIPDIKGAAVDLTRFIVSDPWPPTIREGDWDPNAWRGHYWQGHTLHTWSKRGYLDAYEEAKRVGREEREHILSLLCEYKGSRTMVSGISGRSLSTISKIANDVPPDNNTDLKP